MAVSIPTHIGSVINIPRAKMGSFHLGALGPQRLSTDPLFYATFTLANVLNGSTYWIAETANLANVLASGTQSGTADIVTSALPGTANPMLVTVRVRLAGYVPFETQGFLASTGGSSYIIQTADSTY